jgi:hypothetical protein
MNLDHALERRIMRKRSGGRQNQMMQLSEFRNLIAIMPVEYQASISKRSTWEKHMRGNNKVAGDALRSVFDTFGTLDKVTLSRSDLRGLAHKPDLAQFVMATIVWGYTSGGRGKNIANLIEDFDALTQLLSEARTQTVPEWNTHYEKARPIRGIGLSTYMKFLNFLSVQVQGHAALILDDRIIRVAKQGIFEELAPLRELSKNPVRSYPSYLMHMHSVANSLEVSSEAIEFFLFEFGLKLKRHPADPSCVAILNSFA